MRKAAEELHGLSTFDQRATQSPEESLAQKLFRRGGRNLVLSEMGHVVLLHHRPSGMKRKFSARRSSAATTHSQKSQI